MKKIASLVLATCVTAFATATATAGAPEGSWSVTPQLNALWLDDGREADDEIGGALSIGEYEAGLETAGFEDVSVTFTHEITDGIHGAIVTARNPTDPAAKGLPVVQPAAQAGCC